MSTVEKMDKIYRINYKNRIYIGELSGSNDITPPLQYHIQNCLSWLKAKPKGWEYDIKDQGDNFGWKEALESIKGVWYISVDSAEEKIQAYMDKIAITYPNSPFYQISKYRANSLYETYQQIMYPVIVGSAKTKILFVESLLICANGCQHGSLNYHCNTGRDFSSINSFSLQSYFTAKTFGEFQEKIKKLMPRIYFTWDLKSIPKETRKWLNKQLVRHYRKGVDVVFEEQYVEALDKAGLIGVIKDTTLKSLKQQLIRFQESLFLRKDDPSASCAAAELERFISNLDEKYKPGTTTYTQLARGIRNSFSKEVHLQNIKVEDEKTNEKLADTLLYFFQNFPIDSLFPAQQVNWKKDIQDYVKQSMTKAIQKMINGILEYDKTYSKEQHTLFAGDEKNNIKPRHFFPPTGSKYLPENVPSDEKKYYWVQNELKMKGDLITGWTNYIRNHWKYGTQSDSIYGEQISIWLFRNRDTFYHNNIKSFARQPLTAKEITNY